MRLIGPQHTTCACMSMKPNAGCYIVGGCWLFLMLPLHVARAQGATLVRMCVRPQGGRGRGVAKHNPKTSQKTPRLLANRFEVPLYARLLPVLYTCHCPQRRLHEPVISSIRYLAVQQALSAWQLWAQSTHVRVYSYAHTTHAAARHHPGPIKHSVQRSAYAALVRRPCCVVKVCSNLLALQPRCPSPLRTRRSLRPPSPPPSSTEPSRRFQQQPL